MHPPDSVTEWAQQLQDEDSDVRDEAARKIWERYSPSLYPLARRRLALWLRQREDEEDVLQNMFNSFCRDQKEGRYVITSRDDLWALLWTFTKGKVVNSVKRHTAGRRDVRRDQPGATQDDKDSADPDGGQAALEDSEPSQMQMAQFSESFDRLLQVLPADLRKVAVWKFEGHTNEEIAGKLRLSTRTIEMKLAQIRRRWLIARWVREFEEARREGDRPQIEDYLDAAGPFLAPGAKRATSKPMGDLLCELIRVECKMAPAKEKRPDWPAYQARFPAYADRIRKLQREAQESHE